MTSLTGYLLDENVYLPASSVNIWIWVHSYRVSVVIFGALLDDPKSHSSLSTITSALLLALTI